MFLFDDVEYGRKRKDVYSEWIRENVPEKKVREAKKVLKSYDHYLLEDNWGFTDRVYRALHSSFKVEQCYTNANFFMDILTYLLLPEKQAPRCISEGRMWINEECQKLVEEDVKACFLEDSIIRFFYNQLMESKKDIVKHEPAPTPLGAWHDYRKVTLKILGGAALFYYILISFLQVTENCYKDGEYKFPLSMRNMDGIAYQVFLSTRGIDHQKHMQENIELEKSLKKQKI